MNCKILRTMLVKHGSITFGSGEQSGPEREEWVTRECGVPIFTGRDVCNGCATGWNHPNNYRADGPRPTEVP